MGKDVMEELTAMGDLIHNTWVEVGVVAGVVVLAWIIRRALRRNKPNPLFEPAVCPDCGWRGQVSRYAGRCPQCNRLLGEQKAHRQP
jgi:predicted Zn-ribbon and HTH transcriptional regulator